MKSSITLISISAFILIVLGSAITNAGSSPGGKTGSPMDGQNCTQCHTGTAQTVNSWITTTVPASGYTPGQTYTITLFGTHAGASRLGFELTAENANNTKVGTFSITNAGETKLVNNNQAVSHTGNGITPTGNSKTWTMDWTAPSAIGQNIITFYAAVNAANGNMGTSGDVVYLTSQPISISLSAESASAAKAQINVFPSLVESTLNLHWGDNIVEQISLYSIHGQLIKNISAHGQQQQMTLDMSALSQGTYLVAFELEGSTIIKRFIKQ
jgi:hypothetical protein